MATRQFSCRLHFLPADGAVVGVNLQIFGRGQRIALLHVIQHPQVVAVLLVFSLNFVCQIAQMHDDDEAGHGQENVGPDKHMHVMGEVDGQRSNVKTKLYVVGKRTSFVPADDFRRHATLTHVVEEHAVAYQDMQCSKGKKDALQNIEI